MVFRYLKRNLFIFFIPIPHDLFNQLLFIINKIFSNIQFHQFFGLNFFSLHLFLISIVTLLLFMHVIISSHCNFLMVQTTFFFQIILFLRTDFVFLNRSFVCKYVYESRIIRLIPSYGLHVCEMYFI